MLKREQIRLPNMSPTARALARTYSDREYPDPWEKVLDYRRVRAYAAEHPDAGRGRPRVAQGGDPRPGPSDQHGGRPRLARPGPRRRDGRRARRTARARARGRERQRDEL